MMEIRVRVVVTIYGRKENLGVKLTQDDIPDSLYRYLCDVYVKGQNKLASLTNPLLDGWNTEFDKKYPNHTINECDPEDLYNVYMRDLYTKYGTDVMNKERTKDMVMLGLYYNIGPECQLTLLSDNFWIDFGLRTIK